MEYFNIKPLQRCPKGRLFSAKLLLLLIFPFVASLSQAQNLIADIWSEPAVYVASEEVTFFFDVSGTNLAGSEEDIYMWTWYPTEPDAGNWANPSDFAKLTHVDGNIWKWTITPTEYYGVSADQITELYGLLKNKDGSKTTESFAPDFANQISLYSLDNIKGDKTMTFWPIDVAADRPLSILINTNNTWSGCDAGAAVQGDLATANNVHIHSGINDWALVIENNAENLSKTELTSLGDGIYHFDFIPNDYFDAEETVIETINFVFANDDWSKMGKDAACADFSIIVPEAPEVPDPELILFPQKLTQADIFYMKRTDNEPYVTSLSYEIKAGTKTISGDFGGSNTKFEAYINFADELKGVEGLTSFELTIKSNWGTEILKSTIPFIIAD